MGYKIEIYHNGEKHKHTLYDSEAAYNKWWEKRKEEGWYKELGMTYGLVGFVDGKVDKMHGAVPDKYKIEK